MSEAEKLKAQAEAAHEAAQYLLNYSNVLEKDMHVQACYGVRSAAKWLLSLEKMFRASAEYEEVSRA